MNEAVFDKSGNKLDVKSIVSEFIFNEARKKKLQIYEIVIGVSANYKDDAHVDIEVYDDSWNVLSKYKTTLLSIKPIPLTEEWLVKFGFIHKEDYYIITHGRKSIMIPRYNKDDDFYVLYEEDIGCGFNPLRYIDYVHQLQNICFDLMDKELTCN